MNPNKKKKKKVSSDKTAEKLEYGNAAILEYHMQNGDNFIIVEKDTAGQEEYLYITLIQTNG